MEHISKEGHRDQKSSVDISYCTSRPLRVDELDLARELFVRDPDWGKFYGDKFRQEAERAVLSPPSAICGTFLPDGRLVGVGAALKEGFDYAYWSLTWIFVDMEMRGKGLGRVVVDSLLLHIKGEQAKSHNPNVRVLLSTTEDVASFYGRGWGFNTISTGPLPGEHLMMLDLVGPGLPLRP